MERNSHTFAFATKWYFDRLFSLIGIVVALPLLLVLAIIVKATSKGKVFFLQGRIGHHGKPFNIIKFRTMYESSTGSTVTAAGDERITPFGAWLRRTKMDSLPELFNVLVGQMSFVGPRPDVPGYADKLKGDDRRMLQLRPGMTGPATLKYYNEEEILAAQPDPQRYNDEVMFPDKVRINIEYLDNYSFWTDILIIMKTLAAPFRKKMS